MRFFQPADTEEVYEIERESFPNPWSPYIFLQMHYSNPENFLVVEEDGRIIGYAVFTIKNNPFPLGHLLNLAVKESYKRQGVGSLLLKTVLRMLEEKRTKEVYLEVNKANIAARRFYASFGFKEDRKIKNYYGTGEDAIIMRLKLGRQK